MVSNCIALLLLQVLCFSAKVTGVCSCSVTDVFRTASNLHNIEFYRCTSDMSYGIRLKNYAGWRKGHLATSVKSNMEVFMLLLSYCCQNNCFFLDTKVVQSRGRKMHERRKATFETRVLSNTFLQDANNV